MREQFATLIDIRVLWYPEFYLAISRGVIDDGLTWSSVGILRIVCEETGDGGGEEVFLGRV